MVSRKIGCWNWKAVRAPAFNGARYTARFSQVNVRGGSSRVLGRGWKWDERMILKRGWSGATSNHRCHNSLSQSEAEYEERRGNWASGIANGVLPPFLILRD